MGTTANMDNLYDKYTQLQKENDDLKLRYAYMEQKLNQYEHKINQYEQGKNKTDENDNNSKNTNSDELVKQYKEIQLTQRKAISSLLGWKLVIDTDKIILQSMYSHHEEDKIIFLIDGNGFSLLPTNLTTQYKDSIENYIIKGRSVPAFL